MDATVSNISISSHLLWEYNLATFDYDRSKSIVIERVIQRGTLEDWQEIVKYFGIESILEIAQTSKQLSKKDKNFTQIFIHSSLLHVA